MSREKQKTCGDHGPYPDFTSSYLTEEEHGIDKSLRVRDCECCSPNSYMTLSDLADTWDIKNIIKLFEKTCREEPYAFYTENKFYDVGLFMPLYDELQRKFEVYCWRSDPTMKLKKKGKQRFAINSWFVCPCCVLALAPVDGLLIRKRAVDLEVAPIPEECTCHTLTTLDESFPRDSYLASQDLV